MNNLFVLPVWKKDSSAADFFEDMANIARVHPGRFSKMIVAYSEPGEPDEKADVFDVYPHGVNTVEALGLLELAKAQLLRRAHFVGNG